MNLIGLLGIGCVQGMPSPVWLSLSFLGLCLLLSPRYLFSLILLVSLVSPQKKTCPTTSLDGETVLVERLDQVSGTVGVVVDGVPIRIRYPDETGVAFLPGDLVVLTGEAFTFIGSDGRWTGEFSVKRIWKIGTRFHWKRPMVWFGRVLRSSFPGRGVLRAMVTGERSQLSQSFRKDLARTGTSHLIAVSGLHMSIVVMFSFVVLRFVYGLTSLAHFCAPFRFASLLCIPVVILYMAVVGTRPTTLRAGLFAISYLSALLCGRYLNTRRVFISVAFLLLLLKPSNLSDPGFQLSFLAVSCLLYGPQTGGWFQKVTLSTLVVSIMTMPLVGYHFGQIPTFGVFVNLVAIPITELAIVPFGFLALCCFPLFEGVAEVFLWVASLGVLGLKTVVAYAGSVSPVIRVSPLESLFLGVMASGITALRMHSEHRVKIAFVLFLGLAVSVVGVARNPTDSLRVEFLSVGQGDSSLLLFPGGERWLVDAGPKRSDRILEKALLAHGVGFLDVVVLTHAHADHTGGLEDLFGKIGVGAIWVAEGSPASRFTEQITRWMRQGTRIESPRDLLLSDGVRVRTLWPAGDRKIGNYDHSLSLNDNSVVLHLSYQGRSILLTGDIEKEAEDYLVREQKNRIAADVVKVPHHGSNGSSSSGFAQRTEGAFAIISCGRRNRFQFPSREVLARWKSHGGVHRTDRHGNATIVITEKGKLQYYGHACPGG